MWLSQNIQSLVLIPSDLYPKSTEPSQILQNRTYYFTSEDAILMQKTIKSMPTLSPALLMPPSSLRHRPAFVADFHCDVPVCRWAAAAVLCRWGRPMPVRAMQAADSGRDWGPVPRLAFVTYRRVRPPHSSQQECWLHQSCGDSALTARGCTVARGKCFAEMLCCESHWEHQKFSVPAQFPRSKWACPDGRWPFASGKCFAWCFVANLTWSITHFPCLLNFPVKKRAFPM